jgi:hypothetical protein
MGCFIAAGSRLSAGKTIFLLLSVYQEDAENASLRRSGTKRQQEMLDEQKDD